MRLTGIVRRLGCPASARMLADLAPFAVDPRGGPRFKSLATMDATGFDQIVDFGRAHRAGLDHLE